MKEGKASWTAVGNAAFRTIESFIVPEDERTCYDPFAPEFLGGIYSLIAKSRHLIPTRLLRRMLDLYLEHINPGMFAYIIGRTRCIDDYLQECIDGGIEQLVILGAGYDSRAYGFAEQKGKVTVFEVDHPSTQKVKRAKVKKIFGSLPDHVIYVPIDFDQEKLDQKLIESGYDANLRTLFIWEGVTMYLTAEAVDETLGFVARKSGKGSSIIFDYVFKSAKDGKIKEAEKFIKLVAKHGESLSFGIDEGTIEEFLAHRGFGRVRNITVESLRDAYFRGKSLDREIVAFGAIVHATVTPRESQQAV